MLATLKKPESLADCPESPPAYRWYREAGLYHGSSKWKGSHMVRLPAQILLENMRQLSRLKCESWKNKTKRYRSSGSSMSPQVVHDEHVISPGFVLKLGLDIWTHHKNWIPRVASPTRIKRVWVNKNYCDESWVKIPWMIAYVCSFNSTNIMFGSLVVSIAAT